MVCSLVIIDTYVLSHKISREYLGSHLYNSRYLLSLSYKKYIKTLILRLLIYKQFRGYTFINFDTTYSSTREILSKNMVYSLVIIDTHPSTYKIYGEYYYKIYKKYRCTP